MGFFVVLGGIINIVNVVLVNKFFVLGGFGIKFVALVSSIL